jgi:PEGA domain
LRVTSAPAGVTVLVDGQRRGRTPLYVAVAPGEHHLTFQGSRVMVTTANALGVARETTNVQAILWQRNPAVQQLRPPFPGAGITNAGFLADGRVTLTVALPPGTERQVWERRGDGGLQHLGPTAAHGALAPSPDGRQVAYLAPAPAVAGVGNAADLPLTTVRLWSDASGPERQVYALPAKTQDQISDLAWSPDGRHLLLVIHQQAADSGTTTQLRWLDVVHSSVRTLAELPSAVVAGSFLWSPHGEAVALLTQAGPLVSLCLLGIDPPAFRYLADLGQNEANPLPFPPLAWSADGSHLVYAAPVQSRSNTLSGWLFGTRSAPALFSTTAPWTQSRRLGTNSGNAPVWRADSSLLALAQTNGSGPLRVQAVNPGSGALTPVGTLPLPAASTYAVRWDPTHGQALLAQQGTGGATVFWLLSFTPEVAQ